ncbi:cell wall hydrolase, partial [Escherichia coli]|uniref:cell wall hydrolase n=1 Tax=Escherichia coli TaxID=562 RepID=UPI0013B43E5C
SSICEVVWQRSKGRNGKIVSQFSWTMYGVKRLIPRETLAWRESQRKATLIYSGKEKDITNGATHFHATWMKSTAWSRNVKKVKIGQHFYMKAR